MLLLSAEDIREVYTMEEAIRTVKHAFKMAADRKIDQPLRTRIEHKNKDGDFLFMPVYCGDIDAAALKVINIFPQNIDKGLVSCPAQIMLIDGNTGYVLAILDGDQVTRLRTGASSGAAFDILGKKECRIGGLIGTGGQAPTQLEGMLTVRKLEEVRVYDINQERCVRFCEQMQARFDHFGTKIVPVRSSDEACEDADLFITMTPSAEPVFDGTRIKKGATISCVGTYEPHKHEMDPAVLPRASRIICDYKPVALVETGDLIIPIRDGIITEDDVTGSLGDVINGNIPGREDDDEIIVYETVGIAAQDLFSAKAIYDRAVKLGKGTSWN